MTLAAVWRVVRVPERTKLNVSAFVLPVRMPGAEHRPEQLPMFPDEERARLAVKLLEMAHDLLLGSQPAAAAAPAREAKPKRRYRPQNPRFREWPSFRQYFQDVERRVRKRLEPGAEFTKEMAYVESGETSSHPRTLTRIMTQTYGLQATQWPPSTWPECAPVDAPSPLRPLLERLPPALVAAYVVVNVCHHAHLLGIHTLLSAIGQIFDLS